MPNAGAPMETIDINSWSSVLMRMRCLSGTSRGNVAIIAGLWKAWPMLRAAANSAMSANETSPARMRKPSASETTPTPRSETIITVLRLKRSAMTPPNGDSNPVGSMAKMVMSESAKALPVVSVTYQTAA